MRIIIFVLTLISLVITVKYNHIQPTGNNYCGVNWVIKSAVLDDRFRLYVRSVRLTVCRRTYPTTAKCQLVTDVHVGRRHLRSADVHTCTVPRTQSRLGDRSFGVAGPRLWNSLPVELRQQDICLTDFRRLLKTFCFAETRRIVTSLF